MPKKGRGGSRNPGDPVHVASASDGWARHAPVAVVSAVLGAVVTGIVGQVAHVAESRMADSVRMRSYLQQPGGSRADRCEIEVLRLVLDHDEAHRRFEEATLEELRLLSDAVRSGAR